MSTFSTFVRLLSTPGKLFKPLAARGLFRWMPDACYLKALYRCEMGKPLHLDHPEGFNAKIQWLKLHDRAPEYVKWVDKETAKDMAGQIIGYEHVVPLIRTWHRAGDMDFDSLPDKCVLKCNHDQGSTVIFDREAGVNEEEIRKFFQKRLKKNAYATTREWPYKSVAPKIICEPFLGKDIIDYKFFCFHGVPAFVNIGQKTNDDHVTHITFIDFDWKLMPFQRSDFAPVAQLPEKPEKLAQMIEIAGKLAANTKFVRIDLFCVDSNIYFSEFTLYPTSGLIKFEPENGDKILGDKLCLE